MVKHVLTTALVITLIATCGLLATQQGVGQGNPAYRSPLELALSPDGATLYVSDHTADCVQVVKAETGEVSGTVAVPAPTGMVVSPDGKTLYVSSSSADRVYEIDTATLKDRGTIGVGRYPFGLTLSADGGTLYCCNQFTDDVSVIDVAEMVEVRRIRAVREPRFAALGNGGTTLVVSNQVPLGSNLDDALGAQASLVDLASGEVTNIRLSAGATDVGQVCCSQDGRWAYVVHVLGRWLIPPTQLERGWIATNALTLIDLQEKKRVNTVLLDDLDRGAANPHGIALSPDGKTLYVTHSGSDEVQVINVEKLHKLIAEWPADAPTDLENDLTAVYRAEVRKRVPSGGIGSRGVAASATGAFVANYYSGTVTRIDAEKAKSVQTIALGEQPQMDQVRRGEMLFQTSSVCFQGWQSCATCHPGGRTDGLAWDLLNDGIGNPKNARSLMLSGPTPPAMGHGIREDMRTAVASGFKYILFHVPGEGEVDAVEAYINSMKPERSPHCNADGSLTEAALRGKAIFERADVGCVTCHPAPLYTDLQMYDVGTKHIYDRRGDFDTPTLVEMFRSAPYLHDGSAVTMRDVLIELNKEDKHGKTSHLSEQELADLTEFLLSL